MKTDTIAYRPSWRLAAAVLTVVGRGSPLVLVALMLFLDAALGTAFRLGNPLRLLRAFTSFCLAPTIAAWLLERACIATLAIESDTLVLVHAGRRTEVPLAAIDRVMPWRIPLPASGFWLGLRSGRRFDFGFQVADPVAFIEALAKAGAPPHVRDACRAPAAIYAAAKRNGRRWYHPVLKFAVFGLALALPLFRLRQWIAYGGTFGEYYAYGLKAYLLGFGVYWATAVVYLVLYAAVLRAVVEAVAWIAAHVAPSRARDTRRVTELAARFLYFASVPVFLLRLFFFPA